MRPNNIQDVLAHLPDARQNGDSYVASCPLTGHSTPKGHISVKDAGDKALVYCHGAKHVQEDFLKSWGFTSFCYSRNGSGSEPVARSNQNFTTRYEICDSEGNVVAIHLRKDSPAGKTFSWDRPDSTPGLGGLKTADLPLYGTERLKALPGRTTVVVAEGEKSTAALWGVGVQAVGTVTGAGGSPSMEVLRTLAHFDIVLWPDADSVGQAHMSRIASALQELGAKPRLVEWCGAPSKGDAADAIAQGLDVIAMVSQAKEWGTIPAEDLCILLDDVEAFIKCYVSTGDSELVAIVLWIAHTHVFEAAECTPYLNITSAEKQCGKTRLLEVLGLFVARVWSTARVSAAVLVRKVARETPTLLLDETDSAFKTEKDYSEALRGILNAGYRKNGVASLCVKRGGDFDLADFPVFCPKALAGIGQLPDTIADRSIRINLKRKAPTEQVARFRMRTAKVLASPIRERLEHWSDAAVVKLADSQPEIPAELSDRAADVWEPLFAIADSAGGDWPKRVRQSAIELMNRSADEGLSLGTRLLADISVVMEDRDAPIFSGELVSTLVAREESPWGDLRGRPLDARKLAHLLKPYGVKPHTVRRGTAIAKGYTAEDFGDAFSRYVHIPKTTVTTVTTVTNSKPEATRDGENVTDVTDVTDEKGKQAELCEEPKPDNTAGTVPDLPDYPATPCAACGCKNYWLREASQWGKEEWVCLQCHPKPEGSK